MLSEEEKKAINNLNFIVVTDIYDNEVNINKTEIVNEYNHSVGIVLNLITKLQKENEEKDEQIDLMAKMIDELSEYYTRYNGKNNEFCKEICIEKDIDCIDCIKQYFETKAKKGE